MLFMGVVSLIDGSTTEVLMSPRYGGYQTTTPPPPYYPKATYATTSYCAEVYKYYTTKAPEFYTITYAAPSHYTDVLKYCSAPSYYTTKATEYYMTTHAAPSYYTEASKYNSVLTSQLPIAPIFLNTTLFPAATPRLPLITLPKRVEYYTEAITYYSAPIYSTTTEAAKYYAVPTYYTEAALSCYVEQKYYTDAPVHYTTT
jgi:hypothetical protein